MINFKTLNPVAKLLSIASLVFLTYGYLSRFLNIYFFWESKSIGWVLFLISTGIILNEIKKGKNQIKKKTIIETISIVLISFILVIKLILYISIFNSDAYEVSKKYLKENIKLKNEIGTLQSTSLMLQGGIQKSTDSAGESGNATISLTIKGEWKYKDITIYLSKSPDSYEWVVDDYTK